MKTMTNKVVHVHRHNDLVDVNAPKVVEISVNDKTVWVNVDGVCLFRACRVGLVIVEDKREDKEPRNALA